MTSFAVGYLQVLQPSDIFPSLTAIVSSDDTFSALVAAVGAVDSVDVLSLLETTPGNLAAPINAVSLVSCRTAQWLHS